MGEQLCGPHPPPSPSPVEGGGEPMVALCANVVGSDLDLVAMRITNTKCYGLEHLRIYGHHVK
jgi:hypothetical protein